MSFKYHQFLVLVICFLHNSLFISCEIIDQNQPKGYNIGHLLSESSKYVSASKALKSATESDRYFLNRFSRFLQDSLHPFLLDHVSRLNSSKCFKDLKYVFESAKSEEWAMRMLDSYAKPESGFMLGNVRWVGEFNECLEAFAPPNADTGEGDFHGKYCTLEFHLEMKNMSVPLYVGLCLPESCNPSGTLYSEVENLKFSGPVPTIGDKIDSLLNSTRLNCQPRSTELTTGAKLVICVICIFVLLVLGGTSITVYEHFTQAQRRHDQRCLSISPDNSPILGQEYRGSYGSIAEIDRNSHSQIDSILLSRAAEECRRFLNCFCILTNGKKLLNTSNTEGQMLCVHGIRFLSISWVILCHTFGLAFLGTRNLGEAFELMDAWPYQIIKNGFYSVDAFFLLSGFLLSILFFEEYSQSNGKISWLLFYIHRFIRYKNCRRKTKKPSVGDIIATTKRVLKEHFTEPLKFRGQWLTPVYMMVIAIYTYLTPYLTSGPARIFFKADETCQNSWWWNLLYINNFKGQIDQCMAWSWYLANDMQFYLISPLFLISLYRFKYIGLSLISLFFFITFASGGALTYTYNLISGIEDLDLKSGLLLSSKWDDFFRILYIKPYARIGPYLVGIILGYILFKKEQQEPRKLRLVTLSAGWMIASGITLACLFGPYHQNFSLVTRSFYNAFHHTCFAASLAWVIYVCLTGQGDFVNSFLSWKAWIPFSRLTYCAYLVHPLVQMVYYTSVKRLLEYSLITWIFHYLGFLIVSYVIALVVSLLFESPILRLEKHFRNMFSC